MDEGLSVCLGKLCNVGMNWVVLLIGKRLSGACHCIKTVLGVQDLAIWR
jgi:hypothetical protein